MKAHRARAGRKGGLSRSEKKLAAVRENGKLGGRPKLPVSVLNCFPFTPEHLKEMRQARELHHYLLFHGITWARIKPNFTECSVDVLVRDRDWDRASALDSELADLVRRRENLSKRLDALDSDVRSLKARKHNQSTLE